MRRLRLPFKKEDFFFNDREKKLFLTALRVAGGAVAVCLVVLVVVAIARAGSRPAEAEPPSPTPAPSPAGPALTEEGELTKPMSLSSFVLPDDSRALLEPEYTLFRPRTGKWDRAVIERFWVPPSRIGLENLKKLNDKNIETLFEGVQ